MYEAVWRIPHLKRPWSKGRFVFWWKSALFSIFSFLLKIHGDGTGTRRPVAVPLPVFGTCSGLYVVLLIGELCIFWRIGFRICKFKHTSWCDSQCQRRGSLRQVLVKPRAFGIWWFPRSILPSGGRTVCDSSVGVVIKRLRVCDNILSYNWC